MIRQSCTLLVVLAALAVAKPPPVPPSPWASFGKPIPPFAGPGLSTISVPYVPKSSVFPKFVDPTSLISQKTNLLTSLFGGLGPVDYTSAYLPSGYSKPAPVLYAQTPAEIQGQAPYTEDYGVASRSKRGAVAPGAPKAPKVSSFFPFAAKFSPFAPNFGPSFAPNFPSPYQYPASGFPYSGFPDPGFSAPGFSASGYSAPGYSSSPPKFGYYGADSPSRRRRSIVASDDLPKGSPPKYPGLPSIAEEPENPAANLLKLFDPTATNTPLEALAGIFGPFGPYSPAAVPVTELPIPKSTIVPPGFWAPSSILPVPGEYTAKVQTFLQKLFDSLLLNKTAVAGSAIGGAQPKTLLTRSLADYPTEKSAAVARSIENTKNLAAAKDAIVDTILAELSVLKTDMVATLNDFVAYQKTAAFLPGAKKALKPLSPFAAFFAPPTPDPTLPFKQRMAVLSDVFDLLTSLQKNITFAVHQAIADEPSIAEQVTDSPAENSLDFDYTTPNPAVLAYFNATLIDAIKSRLASLDDNIAGYNKPIAYPGFQAPAKREIDANSFQIPNANKQESVNNPKSYDQYNKRGVDMQLHQGYQSMPPGAIETVQAGGGSVPGHQGGGIKLFNDEDYYNNWAEWAEYFKNANSGSDRHHNHH